MNSFNLEWRWQLVNHRSGAGRTLRKKLASWGFRVNQVGRWGMGQADLGRGLFDILRRVGFRGLMEEKAMVSLPKLPGPSCFLAIGRQN